ncbi:MAG: holo-ACP synthase [Deltaproteobacteria bacterium]|nr:MAG: holo-ACP synthase [Deltaproteobacteria bacterium]
MIVGIGLDVAEIPRIAGLIDRWGDRFVHKLFTPGERAYSDARAHRASHYAARFAAKEAALKALGVPPGLRWHELEVVKEAGRPPRLVLAGAARAAADALGVVAVHLTLTHAAGVAAAVVVAEADERGRPCAT